jgi:hypothetical protein
MADETKMRIINILKNTFDVLDNCYNNNDEAKSKANFGKANSRLIFPSYSKGDRRISEQELRFLFIEQFNLYCQITGWDSYYSVETPTKGRYKFSGEEEPHKTDGNSGQSAMLDVCIHDKDGKRICLIEFKSGNPVKFCYWKDLVKLNSEDGLSFFVHLMESQRRDTLGCVLSKIEDKLGKANYILHTINSPRNMTQYISDSPEEYVNTKWNRLDLSDENISAQIEEYKKKSLDNKQR